MSTRHSNEAEIFLGASNELRRTARVLLGLAASGLGQLGGLGTGAGGKVMASCWFTSVYVVVWMDGWMDGWMGWDGMVGGVGGWVGGQAGGGVDGYAVFVYFLAYYSWFS